MLSDKLLKLLNMTTSDSDGEALNAIRAANRLIKANGLRWDILLMTDQPPTPARDMETDGPSIQEMIDAIRERAPAGFEFNFVDSVERQYKRKGKLSDGQIRGLQNIYDNWLGE